MTCPCGSEAVVTTPMRNAPAATVHACASCGGQFSEYPCQTRNCRESAVEACRTCAKFCCKGHGAGRSGVCAACIRRTRSVSVPSRGPRFGNWHRTERLHHE